MPDTISLVDDADASYFHEHFDPFWEASGRLAIWARGMTSARPYVLCGIAAAAHWFASRGVHVMFEAPSFSRHLEEMRFYDVLPAETNVSGRVAQSVPTNWKALLTLRQIKGELEIDEVIEEFIGNCRASGGWIGGISVKVGTECLAEAISNALQHADSSVGCITGAWTHGRDGPLSIAVVDMGVGIPDHLRRRPIYAHLDDQQALRDSLEERVSGLDDRHRGIGLHQLRIAARTAGKGMLAIRAGHAELRVSLYGKRDRRSTSLVDALPGTWIRLEIAKA